MKPFIVPQQIRPEDMMHQLNIVMMDKMLMVGAVAMVCAAWHMSKYSHNNTPQTEFITGLIDMSSLGAGIAAIGFYAVFRGWL